MLGTLWHPNILNISPLTYIFQYWIEFLFSVSNSGGDCRSYRAGWSPPHAVWSFFFNMPRAVPRGTKGGWSLKGVSWTSWLTNGWTATPQTDGRIRNLETMGKHHRYHPGKCVFWSLLRPYSFSCWQSQSQKVLRSARSAPCFLQPWICLDWTAGGIHWLYRLMMVNVHSHVWSGSCMKIVCVWQLHHLSFTILYQWSKPSRYISFAKTWHDVMLVLHPPGECMTSIFGSDSHQSMHPFGFAKWSQLEVVSILPIQMTV